MTAFLPEGAKEKSRNISVRTAGVPIDIRTPECVDFLKELGYWYSRFPFVLSRSIIPSQGDCYFLDVFHLASVKPKEHTSAILET